MLYQVFNQRDDRKPLIIAWVKIKFVREKLFPAMRFLNKIQDFFMNKNSEPAEQITGEETLTMNLAQAEGELRKTKDFPSSTNLYPLPLLG